MNIIGGINIYLFITGSTETSDIALTYKFKAKAVF